MSQAILAIETSGSDTFVSVINPSRPVEGHAQCAVKDSHNEELAVLVGKALEACECTSGDIGKILVGSGPGSFTGLRIGMSFVKGFSQGAGIPVATVSSLLVASYALHRKTGKRFCGAFTDARRGEVFCALYDMQTATACLAPAIRTLGEFEDLAGGVSKEHELVGFLKDEASMNLSEALAALYKAHPAAFAEIAATPESLAALEPSYLREVAAKTIAERAVGGQ